MLDKILNRTEKDGDCMVYQGTIDAYGYAKMYYKGNVNAKGHRIVYMLFHNVDITGEVVRHTCDKPACINPEHLILGTAKENVQDAVNRGRVYNQVFDKELQEVRLLREAGVFMKDIAVRLNIKFKRVEYINNLIKKGRRP